MYPDRIHRAPCCFLSFWWEEFLTKWTAAEKREVRNSKGTWVETFVEEGNIFGSGAPGVAEAPQTQPDDDVGAW